MLNIIKIAKKKIADVDEAFNFKVFYCIKSILQFQIFF